MSRYIDADMKMIERSGDMTITEAIKWLDGIEKKYIHGGDESFDNSRKQAIHMAIRSLEAWNKVLDEMDSSVVYPWDYGQGAKDYRIIKKHLKEVEE